MEVPLGYLSFPVPVGKLIEEKQQVGELANKGGSGSNQYAKVQSKYISTLSDIGITRNESSISKKIASIPDEEFENEIVLKL